jgi:hypothetical protein
MSAGWLTHQRNNVLRIYRLQCACALLHARDVDAALATAIGVAREPSALRLVCANAYELAARILGPAKEWSRARQTLEQWT